MNFFKIFIVGVLVAFGAQAMAAQYDYTFNLSYDENFWVDGRSGHSRWSAESTVPVNIQLNKDRAWVEFSSSVIVHSVCSKLARPDFPDRFTMWVGATDSFSINNDPFSRVRSLSAFVRIESFDPATGEMRIVGACDWQYTGGGGGSLGINGIAIKQLSNIP